MTLKRFVKETIGDLAYLLCCAIGLTLALIAWIYEGFLDMSPRLQGFCLGFLTFGSMVIILSAFADPL